MAINYALLRSLTAKELISALNRYGFVLDRQTGSHQHYWRADGRRVTVTFDSAGQTFPFKTLKSIGELQARWTEADLKRLKLLK